MLAVVGLAAGQLVDDFSCPDEYQGFYPHLIRYGTNKTDCYERLIVLVSRGAAPVSQNCGTAVSITKLEKTGRISMSNVAEAAGGALLSVRPSALCPPRLPSRLPVPVCLAACLSGCLVSQLTVYRQPKS